MGNAAPINETFPDISISDLAPQAPFVIFRKCGDPTSVAGSPLSRECDDIQGKPMGDCVGASSNDCTNSFKVWSQLLLASFQGLIKASQISDGFKAEHIYFDQTTMTVVGLDNREGQDAKKETTVVNLGLVLTEMVMRKNIGKSDLDPFKAEDWKSLKLETIEQY